MSHPMLEPTARRRCARGRGRTGPVARDKAGTAVAGSVLARRTPRPRGDSCWRARDATWRPRGYAARRGPTSATGACRAGSRAPTARPGAGRRASAAAARDRRRPTCRATARCRPAVARAAGTSSVDVGRTRSGSRPSSSKTARARSNHEHCPDPVACQVPNGAPASTMRSDAVGEVDGPRRLADLVVDDGQRSRARPRGAASWPGSSCRAAPYSHAVRTTQARGHSARTAHSPAALVRP